MRPSPSAKNARAGAAAALVAAACLGAAFGVASCGQILGISSWVDVGASADGASDALSGNDGAGPAEGGADGGGVDGPISGDGGPGADVASGEGGGSACASPREGGAPGVLVDGTQGPFCIDATETTVALYKHFYLDPTVDPSQGQPPECGWNASYYPAYDAYMGDNRADEKPVTSIDWCDARAFCGYWGKRLCGNVFDGGPVDPTASFTQSEWYQACAGQLGQAYPYGDTYDPAKCRTGLTPGDEAGVVPTPTCVGDVAQGNLYDMSGNLAEWENSCFPGTTADAGDDSCVMRGGTFYFQYDAVRCDSRSGGALSPRNGNDTGGVTIRCCWEP